MKYTESSLDKDSAFKKVKHLKHDQVEIAGASGANLRLISIRYEEASGEKKA